MPYVSSGQEIRIDLTGEDHLTPMLRDAASSMAVFTGSAERALYGLARIGQQAAPVLAVAAAFGIMAGQAATVQQNVANLNAVLQTTPNQLAAIRAQGLQLSQVTQFTDSQILLAQRQLAKGQQTPTAIMAETPSVLNLAGATQSQPDQAGTVFIANQRVFQRGMADSADTANILATATDSSLESLIALGQGLKNVDPVAQSAGLGLKTTATAIADLSQQGLQGAQGGTALRTFLQHIERETPAARAEVEKLGLSFYDQAGQMRPLTEIMDQLRQKTAALTEEQRDAALTTIFGTRGALAAQVYAQQGSSGYNQTANDMSSLGTAADINARKLDTLQGSLSKLGSSLNVLEVQGGTTLLPFLKGAADATEHFTNLLTSLNSSMPVIPQLAVAAGAFFGESKLNDLLTSRKNDRAQAAADAATKAAAPGLRQSATDEAALQGYVDRERARYQQELSQYETYQTKMAAYQDAEIAKRAEVDAKIEEVEQAHQARMVEIQRMAAAAPAGAASQAAYEAELAMNAEQAAFAKKMANAPTYAPGRAPTAVDLPTPIALPIVADETVVAGKVAADKSLVAGLSTKVGSVMSGAAAAMGEIAMPVLIAITAKQMIVDPLVKSLVQRTIDNDPDLKKLQTKISFTADLISDPNAFPDVAKPTLDDLQQQKRDADALVRQYQQQLDDAKNRKGALDTVMQDTAGTPGGVVLQGIRSTGVLDIDTNAIQGKLDAAKRLDDQLATQIKSGPLSQAGQDQSLSDAKGTLATQIADIVDLYDNGAISMAEAKKRADSAAVTLLGPIDPNAVRDIAKSDTDVNATITQHFQAAQTQAIQQAQAFSDNMDAAGKAAAAGASNDDILMGIFGVGPNGEDLTAQQVTQAKKHITDLEQVATTAATEVNAAWTEAQAAIGKIDPTKGIGSLVAAADNMKAAGDEMARLGLTNNEFSDLEKISLSFKNIADAEDRATAAFSGYLMEFNSTDDALSKLSAFQKQVVQAEKDAIAAKQAGTATPAQLQLADPKNQAAIAAYFRQQQQGLQGNEASSILGMVQGAPDFLSVDNANRQNVNALGGPQVLYSKLQLETTDAEAAIKLLLDDKHMKVTVDWQYPNGSPAILAANAQYGNATNDSGYNDQPGNTAPPGGGASSASGGDSGGGIGNGAGGGGGFPGFGVAGSGDTSTPNGDASVLRQYGPDILRAAAKYSLAPWEIAALIMHESSGKAGIANSQGSGALGLTQIIPSGPGWSRNYTPEQMALLRGSSPQAADFQIDQGASILRNFLEVAGGDQRNALSAYGGGDPGYYDALLKLKDPVTNALGTGGSSGFGSAAGAGSGPDAMLQAIFGTATSDIGQKNTVVDGITQSVYGWCEKIVDDLVQSATGQNVRFPTADAHVRAALAGDPRAGTVVSAANAQPGDLVGWTGDSSYAGSSAGHIGIYAGNGQYIGTTQDGVRQRAIGSGASTAVYIRPPGDTVADPNNPDTGPGTQPGYGGSKAYANAYANGSTNAYGFNPINAQNTDPSAHPYVPPYTQDIAAGMAALDTFFKKMAAPDVGRVISQMNADAPYFKNAYTRGIDPVLAPSAFQDATDKANAANLTFGAAKAKAMFDALDPSKTDQFAADLKVVVATGGQIGQNAAQWLQYQRDINMATRETVQLQDQMKSAADQSFQRNRDRQDQDLLTAKTNLARDRKIQDDNFTMQIAFQSQQRAIQADTNTENTSYTSTSRIEQDKQRNLQFSQQVQATDLQNKLADTQKAQQETIWQRTSAEQLVAANVKASPTNQGAAANAALLAGMHDQDLAQKDLNTKAIDDIQLQIREEARKANLDSFNLATETLQAQRAHEDAMQRLSDRSQKVAINQQNESNREQAQATKNQRDDQDHAIALAAIRLSQDRALEDWQRGAQKEIDLNATRTKTAQDGQSALDALLNDAISGMTTFGTTALGVVDSLNSAVGNAAAQGPNIGTSGAIRRLDGHWQGGRIPGFEGMSLVGEGPGGKILDSTEIISAPGAQVTPIAMLRALGLGGNTTTIGINAPITIGNVSDIVDVEETIDNALAPLRAQLRQAITKSRDYNTSIGIQRFGG